MGIQNNQRLVAAARFQSVLDAVNMGHERRPNDLVVGHVELVFASHDCPQTTTKRGLMALLPAEYQGLWDGQLSRGQRQFLNGVVAAAPNLERPAGSMQSP